MGRAAVSIDILRRNTKLKIKIIFKKSSFRELELKLCETMVIYVIKHPSFAIKYNKTTEVLRKEPSMTSWGVQGANSG